MKNETRIPEMTEERIINCWKMGYTIQQLVKDYVKNKKQNGIKIKQIDAQRHIEPIIFKYQTNLFKS